MQIKQEVEYTNENKSTKTEVKKVLPEPKSQDVKIESLDATEPEPKTSQIKLYEEETLKTDMFEEGGKITKAFGPQLEAVDTKFIEERKEDGEHEDSDCDTETLSEKGSLGLEEGELSDSDSDTETYSYSDTSDNQETYVRIPPLIEPKKHTNKTHYKVNGELNIDDVSKTRAFESEVDDMLRSERYQLQDARHRIEQRRLEGACAPKTVNFGSDRAKERSRSRSEDRSTQMKRSRSRSSSTSRPTKKNRSRDKPTEAERRLNQHFSNLPQAAKDHVCSLSLGCVPSKGKYWCQVFYDLPSNYLRSTFLRYNKCCINCAEVWFQPGMTRHECDWSGKEALVCKGIHKQKAKKRLALICCDHKCSKRMVPCSNNEEENKTEEEVSVPEYVSWEKRMSMHRFKNSEQKRGRSMTRSTRSRSNSRKRYTDYREVRSRSRSRELPKKIKRNSDSSPSPPGCIKSSSQARSITPPRSRSGRKSKRKGLSPSKSKAHPKKKKQPSDSSPSPPRHCKSTSQARSVTPPRPRAGNKATDLAIQRVMTEISEGSAATESSYFKPISATSTTTPDGYDQCPVCMVRITKLSEVNIYLFAVLLPQQQD